MTAPGMAALRQAATDALDDLAWHVDRFGTATKLTAHLEGDSHHTAVKTGDLSVLIAHHNALHAPEVAKARQAMGDLVDAATITAPRKVA